MGFLSGLFGGGGGSKSAIESIGDIIDDVWTSDEEEMTAERLKMIIAMKPTMAQNKINEISASHRSVFVSGARPFILWTCGVGLGMGFIVNPLIEFYTNGKEVINLPMEQMMDLTIAMLGLAGLRTIEKLKGVSK